MRAAAAARQENMGLGGATRETPKLAEAGRDARTEFKVSAGQFPVLSVHFHLFFVPVTVILASRDTPSW